MLVYPQAPGQQVYPVSGGCRKLAPSSPWQFVSPVCLEESRARLRLALLQISSFPGERSSIKTNIFFCRFLIFFFKL